jgi:hypothetical protein
MGDKDLQAIRGFMCGSQLSDDITFIPETLVFRKVSIFD